ncbi:MAG: hypothetical protein ACI9TK_000973 [Flavobacteriaceae bacterium]|jgi:hypothetical protein
MKHFLFTFSLSLIITFSIQAQEFKSLDKSPMDMIEFPIGNSDTNKSLRVLYSRPQLNGRDLNKLVPMNKLWRTGANESTEVTFYRSMKFGDKSIPVGSYTLYTIPGEKQWIVILNSATHVWGSYNYKEENDIARISVPVSEGKKSLEALSMAFEKVNNGIHLHIGWGNLRLAIPFTK